MAHHDTECDGARYIEIIERNGKQLLALINDLLDLARIEAGREEVRVSRFSIPEAVNEVVAMLEPQAREKGIALESRIGDDMDAITGDPDKCRHILRNLVGNAVKFTEKGHVLITARRDSDTPSASPWPTPASASPRIICRISSTNFARPTRARPVNRRNNPLACQWYEQWLCR